MSVRFVVDADGEEVVEHRDAMVLGADENESELKNKLATAALAWKRACLIWSCACLASSAGSKQGASMRSALLACIRASRTQRIAALRSALGGHTACISATRSRQALVIMPYCAGPGLPAAPVISALASMKPSSAAVIAFCAVSAAASIRAWRGLVSALGGWYPKKSGFGMVAPMGG